MEQLSLFDAPNLLLGDYYQALKKGEWEAIPGIVKSIDKLKVDLPGLKQKKRFWKEELGNLQENREKSPRAMVFCWKKIEPKLSNEALKTEKVYLEKIWFNQILLDVESDEGDYITEDIHPTFLAIKIGKYREGRELALKFLKRQEEDSKVRGYLAYCLNETGNKGGARTALSFALFYDPFSVDSQFVFSEDIRKLLDALQIEYPDPRLLRASWPFETWLDSLLEVPPNKKLVEKIYARYHGNIFRHKLLNKVDTQLYFNHLVYVSEVTRKNSTLINENIVGLRKHMKNIHPGAFKKYIERIR